jgi:hypothetical protein
MSDLLTALTQIRKNGIAFQHNWKLLVHLPTSDISKNEFGKYFGGDNFTLTERLSLSVETVDFPSTHVSAFDMRVHNLRHKQPYNVSYEDITITFRCSEDMFERKLFEAWIKLIQNPKTRNFNYRNEYEGTFEIIQYSRNGGNVPVYGMKLVDAYPIDVSIMSGDQGAENSYHRSIVTITYRYSEPLHFNDQALTTQNFNNIQTYQFNSNA